MGSSARRLRQVGSSGRRLRQVGWSARRLPQEPFDEPSARMKCHWRAFFELYELSAESLRQVARTRKIPRATQDCSKLVTPMCWKWLSRICEGQHQVEPNPIVHNPPSRRLNHRRHHQWNFIIEHFQIRNNRSSSCVINKHTKQLGWLAWNHTTAAPVEEVLAVPERDTVSQVTTASEKLDAVADTTSLDGHSDTVRRKYKTHRISGVEELDRVALDGLEKADVCDSPNVTYLRLPRQPASANGATTPGFSGPFSSQCVDAAHADTRVPFCSWQLGSFLFGMPARGPSRPLLVGFRVAALDSVRHCKVAGGH